MPVKIENPLQVTRNIKGLFALEQEVAQNLWSFLDQPNHMEQLRDFALAALHAMQHVGPVMWVHVVNRIETQLAIYSKMARNEYLDFCRVISRPQVTPGDIADVIRVFGAWVEAGAPTSRDYYRTWEEKKKGKEGHLLGDSDTEFHDQLFAEKQVFRKSPLRKVSAWAEDERQNGGKVKLGTRQRDSRDWKFSLPDEARMSPQLQAYLRREQPVAGKPFTYVDGGAPVLMSPDGKASAGRLGKGPVGHSIVGRMERVFGLLDLDERSEGADISGTTADQIFFLRYWSGRLSTPLDPTLYLLPLATLVTPYHHSLLEVALTLSYNNDTTGVSYVSGQYATLVSVNAINRDRVLADVLLPATQDKRNCRMLVYYQEPWSPEGSWIFEPRMEMGKWTRVAKMGDPLLYSMCRGLRGNGGWPNKSDIEKMML